MGNAYLTTHDRLRRDGMHLIVRDGFDAVSARDIASLSGVTERTFYRHFRSTTDVPFSSVKQIGQRFTTKLAVVATEHPPFVAMHIAATRALGTVGRGLQAELVSVDGLVRCNEHLRVRAMTELQSVALCATSILQRAGASQLEAELSAHVGIGWCAAALTRHLRLGTSFDDEYRLQRQLAGRIIRSEV